MGYGAHRPPAQKLSELYAEDTRDHVRILDVAAGTGLLGLEVSCACVNNTSIVITLFFQTTSHL